MYSLNVPLPSAVSRLASTLARDLPGAQARARGEHTLVCKRLGSGDGNSFGSHHYDHIETEARRLLQGTPTFEARIDGIDCFETAATGPSPVVYLVVASPELERLHHRLSEYFEPMEGIEGPEYTPHVTIARGGSLPMARRLTQRTIEPITWTVEKLEFYDATRGQRVSRVSLPA